MWPAGNPGNVEIVILLVHEWISVKYPGAVPGINILSIFGIVGIFGFRWARPPAGSQVLCPNPLICHKMLKIMDTIISNRITAQMYCIPIWN